MREYPNQRELYEMYYKQITEMYPGRQSIKQKEVAAMLGQEYHTTVKRYGIHGSTDIVALAMRLARYEAQAEARAFGA